MAERNNPSKGGKPDKLMRDSLILALHRAAEDAEGKPTKRLAMVADKLVDRAMEGDVPAIKEIFDRVDGKALQRIEATGADGGPIQTQNVDERPPLETLILAAQIAASEGETRH